MAYFDTSEHEIHYFQEPETDHRDTPGNDSEETFIIYNRVQYCAFFFGVIIGRFKQYLL